MRSPTKTAVYTLSVFVRDGGLISYGIDQVDTNRRAATYVDRILRVNSSWIKCNVSRF